MITVSLPSGQTLTRPAGVRAEEILRAEEFQGLASPIVAVLVNKALASLTYRLEVNCHLEPVLLASREGANIYRRSLCLLLAIAAKQLYPTRRLVIGHALGRGYFYYFDGRPRTAAAELAALKQRMAHLASQALPIVRTSIAYNEAVRYFEQSNQPDTVLLLRHRNDPKVPVHACGEFLDLAHAPLVPHTGMLKVFDLREMPPGFLLRYPPWNQPHTLGPFKDSPLLFSVYREYKDWGKILNLASVGQLNELINARQIKQFIPVAEALHDKKIALIADRISERRDTVRLALVAGPSSSGKTTFAKKLSIQLQVLGRNPFQISLDDYFLPRDRTPRNPDGRYDYESLRAIDVQLLNEHLLALLRGEEVSLPRYDFPTGERRASGSPRRLPERAVIILEGIHCLNDALTPAIAPEARYKIYVSALTQLNLDDHNRISTTDNRLLRRIVRDHQFRGHSAAQTLSMWQSVRTGEDTNIFPFQNNADSAFNSALDYELSVLKVYAEPLLKTVKPEQEGFSEALRLLSFIGNFAPIPASWVPEYSILREFIGDSGFKY